MLVYANHLTFQGAGSDEAVFKAIGGWLKEQLGFGLHPDQLKRDGEFNGTRGEVRSSVRVLATTEDDPELYAWVLRSPDDKVWGRQWVVEVGLKRSRGALNLSCVVKTDEHSTLIASPVVASQPRLVRYVVSNVQHAEDAEFAVSVSGVAVKTVGQDVDSYRGLLAEIERRDRDAPVVLVSPTRTGEYLLNPVELQDKLLGLAQVVQVSRDFNSYDMTEVLGPNRSAWGGAVNILNMPTATGLVRGRYFLADAITGWGETQYERMSHVLAWVTNNTNISRLRRHIRPEGVAQLALRRRMQASWARSEQMDAGQLRAALAEASQRAGEQEKYFDELVNENSQLETRVSDLTGDIADVRDELGRKDFTITTLKDQLSRAGGGRTDGVDVEELLELVCQTELSPLDCLELIERTYGNVCTVLPSAKSSAEEMDRFMYGRTLLDLLRRLMTQYRSKLMEGGDSQARSVFGKNEYAAKESETVMASKALCRQRTFGYEGEDVEMFRHLKIGADDDVNKTIRVHFHWDADRKKIVIGYCGKHLPVSSR